MKKFIPLCIISFLLTGCVHLDIVICTLNTKSMKAYCNPSLPDSKKQSYTLDMTDPEDFQKLHKFAAVSPDDLAQIQRALNK